LGRVDGGVGVDSGRVVVLGKRVGRSLGGLAGWLFALVGRSSLGESRSGERRACLGLGFGRPICWGLLEVGCRGSGAGGDGAPGGGVGRGFVARLLAALMLRSLVRWEGLGL